MPEQESLPLEVKAPINKFIIPDDSVDLVSKPEEKVAEVPAAAEPAKDVKAEQNKEEQAPSTEPEAKPEEVTPEQAAKREGRRFERKLDKAYKARAEANARAELLEKRLQELEKAQPPKQVDGEPTLEKFDFDPEKYAQAKAEYAKTQVQKEIEAKQRTEAQQKAHQALVSSWEEKADKGAEKYDDWETVVGTIQPTVPFIAALMEADNGHDIAYHLGKHPAEARKIASLPPMSQVREIGKLEAKLLSEPVKPKAPSKAPAPITPLSGTGSGSTPPTLEDADMATFIKMRQKKLYGK